MKIKKSLLSFACAIMVALSFTACGDDWGRQDDPAGGQIYPSKQTVATYDFEYSDEKPEYSDMISHDEGCEVISDKSLASNVLHMNGKGGAKIANPFNSVKLQNGAAITFAVKIDAEVAEDGTAADVDLTRPLISFGSDEKDAAGNDVSARFYFTANGQVVFKKPGQLESLSLNENDPASVKTGILTPNEWHFVALQLSTEGYQIYVDGKKSLTGYQTSSSATSFQYKTLVDSINSLPYLYIGGDSKLTADETNAVSIDDVTLIRNMMEEKDWNKTVGGNGGGDAAFNYVEYVNGESPTIEIGTSDCSAAWWTTFSDYYRIPANGAIHLKFTNHTSGAGNWNNWNLCVSTDDVRNGGKYSEYFVIRSDAYGWGNSYASGKFENDGYPTNDAEWADFRANMEGAIVDMTIARSGKDVIVTAVETCKNGKVYVEKFTAPCNDENEVLRAFLIVDGSYLVLDQNSCTVQASANVETTEIGTSDCSAAWWTTFSDYFQIPAGVSLHLGFTNHTSGAGNWNNWNLCVSTDDERNGGNYSEYFVLRSDAYGWGNSYASGKYDNEGYPTNDAEWGDFRANMEGAKVDMTIARSGTDVKVTAVQTCTNGKVYIERFTAPCNDANEVLRAFLIVDSSYLVMDPTSCYIAKPMY